MRVPAGAPVPFWLSFRNKLPGKARFARPTLGTVAVIGTVVLTVAAVFSVAVYPKIENDYYKNAQAQERALLRGTREDFAQGLRMSNAGEHSTDAVEEDQSGKVEVTEHEFAPMRTNDYSLDQFDIDSESIELNHTRADHIPDLSRFKELQELILRTNLLKSIGPNLLLLTKLTELDLYENQIEAIENLETLVNLKKLDLSFNRIREIKGLSTLTKLTHIYLVHNKITEIKGLDSLLELELLEIGDNSLPANRLTKVENLEELTNLEEIYISDQGIDDITHLAVLKNLTTIDVSNNNLASFDGVTELKELSDFWVGVLQRYRC
ncbi:leucine Rich repeat-containing domain protein [Oesophagostomum dentatum]|uniref:Leucine Rich repeat-containing domain protein n=1 Tax=Oesophagostomum dentatum TaxID=61180 RepID=A0A0B1SH23_OESDE|nr:leucine Rich repeat-containing domain protein [Oesophagostomum dentatum]